MRHTVTTTLLRLLPAALLAGCAVGPNFSPPRPALPAHWSGAATSQAAGVTSVVSTDPTHLEDWWARFNDAGLTSLIERSRASNLDERAAVLRITEARLQRDNASANLWPQVSANASWSRQRLSESTPTGSLFKRFNTLSLPGFPAISVPNPYNQYQLGLGASWEIDLFGRVRRSVEAASADVHASEEDRRAVLVSLDSDVARAYIDLRGTQQRRQVAQASLDTERDLLELTQQRQAAGLTTDEDVENAAAQVESTQAQIPLLELEITQDINQLSRLIDREPQALRAELDEPHSVPPVPPQVPIGLPADLARQRPDIREAEQRLHAATARIGVAVADVFPRLTLGAQGGYQSQSASNLLQWASRFGSIGPTLELPVFDRGRWITIRLQDLRAQEAAIDYQRTVLGALHEVENALAAYQADQLRRRELTSAAEHSREALTLARQRYASGVATFLVVLDAQRTLQQNELALAESVTTVATDLVTLYRTLGGANLRDSDHT